MLLGRLRVRLHNVSLCLVDPVFALPSLRVQEAPLVGLFNTEACLSFLSARGCVCMYVCVFKASLCVCVSALALLCAIVLSYMHVFARARAFVHIDACVCSRMYVHDHVLAKVCAAVCAAVGVPVFVRLCVWQHSHAGVCGHCVSASWAEGFLQIAVIPICDPCRCPASCFACGRHRYTNGFLFVLER